MKGKGEAGQRHYVNAIIEDEFWQVLRHVKLGETTLKLNVLCRLAVYSLVLSDDIPASTDTS